MPDIITSNQLIQAENGVYHLPDKQNTRFAYSDGAESEQYLHSVLSGATDLGCRSAELQQQIIDWPSEYHLSSDRSNLLRPFNLDNINTVLELGSGCSAISRYLGETGKQVDAVEGSAIRAGLGRLRCRDLDNVRIINANYNELDFPRDYYDMVLFVGVIEYARKFHPQASSDREAASAILAEALTLLKPGGVVLVAIENRLGLKYMLGAHEDHYARRYIGINGYRQSAGIATYSHPEWRSLVAEAGFEQCRFSYPFPDYKIPSVVLSEDYVLDNPFAGNHLEGMLSRDYYSPVTRSATETICWQAASHGGFLGDIANSFCILMGRDGDSLSQIQDFDFCHGPGSARKNQFAVTTSKPAGQNTVYKTAVTASIENTQGISQKLDPQAFTPGVLLSGQWLRTILIYVRRDEFEQAVREYYSFLVEAENNATLNIDLLPINILLTEQGEWQVFDQEWVVSWALTKEYLLFRALLTFIVTNWVYLKDFLGWLELQTVRDFIEYGFHTNLIHLSENLDQFIEMENRFQKAIARDEAAQDVSQLLTTVFDFSAGKDKVYSAVYWCGPSQDFVEEQSVTEEVIPSPEKQTVRFNFSPKQDIAGLRLNPFDIRKTSDIGFFQIHRIALIEQKAGVEKVLWSIDNAQDIARHCKATSAEHSADDGSLSWMATTDFPKLDFFLPDTLEISQGATYGAEVEVTILRTMEYALAYNRYLVSVGQTARIEDRARRNLTAMQDKLSWADKRMGRLEQDIVNQQSEIDSIKTSHAFRIGSRIVNALASVARLFGRA